ncbi:MAG: DUF6444 domain-containing protein [Actinobacteria bacterium]|nr:DUF6444 domain-containing protein [Actinomycetota bacterium]MCA1701281.1 DUF6444 domain-containing protein [Actinomycetota bacterium]
MVARVEELERQAGRSSRNSSLAPSRDSPDARKQRPKEAVRAPSGRSARAPR